MAQEVYGKEVAKLICELLVCRGVPNPPVIPDELEIRDDGVYVKNSFLASDPGEQAFTWTPACEMDWPGAPDPLTAPSLPIPFTARYLAAFMLDAVGYGIQEIFGRIDGDPDEAVLGVLGIRATKVRMVIRDAYNLAQQAQRVAGADNYEEQQHAADLLLEYDGERTRAEERYELRERVIIGKTKDGALIYGDFADYLPRLASVNRVAEKLKVAAQKTSAEADARHMEWRKAMVHQLLHPALLFAPSATPAPVVTVSGGPATAKPNWRHLIQAEAWEHWLRLRASGCNPSIYSICGDMAKWCLDNGIKGDKGQDPKAGTIRNTVLGGGHWTSPHHSVAEAKKHIAQIAQTKVAQTAQ